MIKSIIKFATVLLAICLIGCNTEHSSKTKSKDLDSSIQPKIESPNSFISLFEIPATNISRAIDFYQAILDIDIEKMEMPGMEMGIFPYQEQVVTGVIMKGEGYIPTADGVTIYLNGGDNLQFTLDKIELNGGSVLVPKTAHADGNGYFALFLDSEGNKLGLNSPN